MVERFSATAAAAVFDECQANWDWFDSISIEHCHREANQVAHVLARNLSLSKHTCNWIDEPPSFIIAKLANDVTTFSHE